MKYLIVNTGSASKKYSLFDGMNESIFLHLEKEGEGYISTFSNEKETKKSDITAENYEKSLDYLFSLLLKGNYISSKNDISGVGVRIVAPGIYFQVHRLIDKEYVKNLKHAEDKAPLHIEAVVEEIKKISEFFEEKISIVGISDSAFHRDMPKKSRVYSIPVEDTEKFEIYRYGYHGISLSSITSKLREVGKLEDKIIICHMGGGVSLTALKNGKSVDTTMGFTPLEGLTMATRVGDIDSGAVVHISKVLGINDGKLKQYLSKKCGLLGLSGGLSDDVRSLLKEENKNENARNALDIYVYKIQKQIGAFVASLGGLDAIVFSGTVGERSFIMRERICNGLEVFGVKLDKVANDEAEQENAVISDKKSRVRVEVVKTNEMRQIAEELVNILQKK